MRNKAVLKICGEILHYKLKAKLSRDSERDCNKFDNDEEAKEKLLSGPDNINVTHLTGTILTTEKVRLQKLIFRATRGLAFLYLKDMDKPIIDYKGNKNFKSVYVIIFQNGEYFMDKLSKILDSFMGNRFEISVNTFEKEIEDASRKIKDIRKVVQSTNSQLKSYIEKCNRLEDSEISKFQLYKLYLIKEKAIFETLNKMQTGHQFFIGAFWLPSEERKQLNNMLELISQKNKIRKPQIVVRKGDSELPPTFIRVNEFTYPFQEITNTYGIPSYKEVNPSYFGIVTFPFLFGVMFGDICHGSILFLFASFLCLQPKLFHRSALASMVPYRYLLLLMGISALF